MFQENESSKSGKRTVKKENKNEKASEVKTSKTKEEVSSAPKSEPLAKITKVGAMLKEVRQKKGVKLADVAKVLCIRKF